MPIKQSLSVPPKARVVAAAIDAAGGRAWLVGGWVRDTLLERTCKDLDIEVHGLEADALERALRRIGIVRRVGKSFSVYKLVLPGMDEQDAIDVALPEPGVEAHDLRAAALRRDLSINALAASAHSGEIVDHVGGRDDLSQGRIRHCSARTFGLDPLRALRAAGLAARLGFTIDPALMALCQGLDLSAVAGERVVIELEKMLTLAPRPSTGVALALRMGALQGALPALGSVAPETLASLDRAQSPAPELRWPLLLAVLHLNCPDPGPSLDRLRVHSMAGRPIRTWVLEALGAWPALVPLVGDSTLRRLAEQCRIDLSAALAGAATASLHSSQNALRAAALGCAHGPLPSLIQGRDLLRLGLPTGPELGRILAGVRAAQLEGEVADTAAATALASRLWSQSTTE